MVEVVQEDRDAAATYGRAVGIFTRLECREIIAGSNDDCSVIQAFARHRIAAEQRGKLEGARLVIEALTPFADCCDQIADDESDEEWAKFRLLIKDYRRARAAIHALDPAKIVDQKD